MKENITNEKTIDSFFYNLDLKSIEKGIKKSLKEFDEGKGIEAKLAMDGIHKEVFGKNLKNKLNNYCLTPEEDDMFMSNIDMDELKKGIERSEEDISNGRVIDFKQAMIQIDKEVFGEEL